MQTKINAIPLGFLRAPMSLALCFKIREVLKNKMTYLCHLASLRQPACSVGNTKESWDILQSFKNFFLSLTFQGIRFMNEDHNSHNLTRFELMATWVLNFDFWFCIYFFIKSKDRAACLNTFGAAGLGLAPAHRRAWHAAQLTFSNQSQFCWRIELSQHSQL